MKLGENQIKHEIQRMKDTGKIDGLVGAKEVGRIIDLYNQLIDKDKEKQYDKEITARNQYYWKLWKRVADEIKSGARSVKKLVPRKIIY
jgi:F0F1-type ATP synthase alpha subunit